MHYGKSWVCLQGHLSSWPSGDGVASSSNSESGYTAHSFCTPVISKLCVKQSQTYPKIWQGRYTQLFCCEVLESKLLNYRLSTHYFHSCVGTVLSSLTSFPPAWVKIEKNLMIWRSDDTVLPRIKEGALFGRNMGRNACQLRSHSHTALGKPGWQSSEGQGFHA